MRCGTRAAVTVDLRELGRVLESGTRPRAPARIEGGAFGPALEAQLKPHALTLRHFPQKFSSARRSAAGLRPAPAVISQTLYTHIDDLVEIAARRHAEGRDRDAAAPRLGRGAKPRPAA